MKNKKRILFIVNPLAGTKSKKRIPGLIEKALDLNQFEYKVLQSDYKGHCFDLAKANCDQYDVLVAIGGDGTVNEVASALLNSSCALGIIPCGSGNGIARHLQLPLNHSKAIARLNAMNATLMDVGLVGERYFLASCGFGFDAHIAHIFDRSKERGFLSYIKLVVKEFRKYQNRSFVLNESGQSSRWHKFLLTVSNCSEFGNGFAMSPLSNESDGILELVGLDNFKIFDLPKLVRQFFNRKIYQSAFFSAKAMQHEFEIMSEDGKAFEYHIDGEAMHADGPLKIAVLPRQLKVLV